MAVDLFITDDRMFKLMDWAIKENLVNNETEFFEKIGCQRGNASNLRKGKQSFTKEHILKACELTGVSADYIFGFSKGMQRKVSKSALDLIKEAVTILEAGKKK